MSTPSKSAPLNYSRTQIFLHWLIVLLVFFQLLFDMNIGRAFHQKMDGTLADPGAAQVHVLLGIAVLALTGLRLILRLTRGTPALPEEEPKRLKGLAHGVHWGFYAALLLIPISGLLAWFGLVGPAAGAHEVLTKVLWLLIALHVAGALYQQLVLRSNILARMSPHG